MGGVGIFTRSAGARSKITFPACLDGRLLPASVGQGDPPRVRSESAPRGLSLDK